MQNVQLDDSQAGIKIAGRNINRPRYTDDTILMVESEEELKSLSMKVKEESKKSGLKLNIQKTKIIASSPITSWQIDGETMETVTDFLFLSSQITADPTISTAAMKLKDSCIGEGNGNPLQYSCLENPMDGGPWWATVHGVAKNRTRLSDFTFMH